MTGRGKSLRFISWNLKGVNQPTKMNKVMAHLNQLKGDVFFSPGNSPPFLRGSQN